MTSLSVGSVYLPVAYRAFSLLALCERVLVRDLAFFPLVHAVFYVWVDFYLSFFCKLNLFN